MAVVLNVEKSKYINSIIEIYTKNKVGQYSKFLNYQPTFVTYYHVNQVLSRADVGTGNVESELGERSPIRFNKILNFPLYNLPELKPDINVDETGADIELDCTSIICLPNTIHPRSGDHFIIKLPNTKEFLFRVTNFEYNTIQSNDYYRIDAELHAISTNIEEKFMKGQIVEEYYTIFENIGTNDRCFFRTRDSEYLNSLSNLFYKLRDYYINGFYKRDINSFTYGTARYSEFGREMYRYDSYLEHFINESNIYYDENSERSLILTPANVLQDQFNLRYSQLLYDAVIKRSIEMLRPYCYMVTNLITAPISLYNKMGYNGENVSVYPMKNKISAKNNYETKTCECGCEYEVVQTTYDLDPMPKCTPTWTLSDGQEYFKHEFLQAIIDGYIDTDDYYELIIFNFIHNIKMEIDRNEIMQELDINEKNYYFLPMILYIIRTQYTDYFATERDVDM